MGVLMIKISSSGKILEVRPQKLYIQLQKFNNRTKDNYQITREDNSHKVLNFSNNSKNRFSKQIMKNNKI